MQQDSPLATRRTGRVFAGNAINSPQQPHPAKQVADDHLFAPYPRVVDVVQGLLEPERLEAEKDDTPVNNDRCSCVDACFAAARSVPWRLLASTEA